MNNNNNNNKAFGVHNTTNRTKEVFLPADTCRIRSHSIFQDAGGHYDGLEENKSLLSSRTEQIVNHCFWSQGLYSSTHSTHVETFGTQSSICVKRVLEFPPKTDRNDEVSSSPQIVENQILSSRPSTLSLNNLNQNLLTFYRRQNEDISHEESLGRTISRQE